MELTNDTIATTFKASGLTQAAFCKEHGISIERLRYYLYRKHRTVSEENRNACPIKATPAFISFNNPVKTIPDNSQQASINVSIIHCTFTPETLS